MSASGKPSVAIIDYGMGNMFSVKRACEHVGLEPLIAHTESMLMNSSAAILPGVGAFGDAMDNLKKMGLVEPIKKFVASGKPFMGICLGMQLLMSDSEEFGKHKGLDIIKGPVRRFPPVKSGGGVVKVPQVGWNQIRPSLLKWDASPLKNIEKDAYMYFVHSYYVVPEDKGVVLSVTDYEGTEYCSSILWKNIFACQFHPEKSADQGLTIYSNWVTNAKALKGIVI